ncbi:unannotated protein [freshwater metagenome]|uniref:Unannotated protein n=1 Tax=freshwater metagenome TaxID=449393 RepID=A0A6J7EKZ1_9ZZZZ
MLDRKPAALSEGDGHVLDARARSAREETLSGAGDRDVRDPHDTGVQHDLVVPRRGPKCAYKSESADIDAFEYEAGGIGRLDHRGDHVAARRRQKDLLTASLIGLDDVQHRPVQHRLIERHRDQILRLEGDGCGKFLRIVERRQLERAHDDLLVRHTDPHAPREIRRLRVERAQGLAQRAGVCDLSLAHDARLKRLVAAALHDQSGRGHLDLRSGDAERVDVEAGIRLGSGGHAM